MNDTYETITCPACGKDMKKIFDTERGTNLDICVDGCGGIFFDNREFKLYDEQAEDVDCIKSTLEGKTFASVDETLTRVCPLCGNNMTKNFVSVKKEVQIDECYNCGAKFLDNGELKKIRSQYATEKERSEDLLKSVSGTIGLEMAEMDAQHEKNLQNRSSFLKSLDKMFLKGF